MALESTVYELVTRFTTENAGNAQGQARGIETAFVRADRAAKGAAGRVNGVGAAAATARTKVRHLGDEFAFLQRFSGLGTLVGGMTAVSAVTFAATKTASNLNQALNTSLALGAQFNLVFRFSDDPAKNMVKSLEVGHRFMREMARDAAQLPGELADFQRAMSVTGLPILSAGGNLNTVRKMLADLSIVAPMAGQNMEEGGRQTMRMLTGQASVGDNPLFAMLRAANLLPDAAKFNKMAPAKKLEELEKALASLARNPVFRERLIHTFDVQLGTLSDNLFGLNGILGRLGAGPFNGVLDGLVALNRGIERNTPEIVDRISRFIFQLRTLADLVPSFQGSGWEGVKRQFMSTGPGRAIQTGKTALDIASNQRVRALALLATSQEPYDSTNPGIDPMDRAMRIIKARDAKRMAEQGLFKDVTGRRSHQPASEFHELMHPSKTNPDAGITKQTVIQHIKIELDLDTDISPEAFVQRVDRALRKTAAKQSTFPTKGKGAPAPVPKMSSIP
jgi:hypothetical protein